MSLVNELQEIAESADISMVLRKAKRVSGKLGQTDITHWINQELNGYATIDSVPEYRKIQGILTCQIHGHIPAGYGLVKSGTEPVLNFPPLPMSVTQDIGTLTSIPNGNMLCEAIAPELETKLKSLLTTHENSSIMQQISLVVNIPNHEINRIVQTVRDRVLDWAIQLEQKGITGMDQSFTQAEKDIIKNTPSIINYGSMKTTIQNGDSPIATQIDTTETKKTFFDYVCSWYGGIIGGTASILGLWWFAWDKWNVWFFGLHH